MFLSRFFTASGDFKLYPLVTGLSYYFSENLKGYFRNYCTNARLAIDTNFSALFILNPNTARKREDFVTFYVIVFYLNLCGEE